MVSRWINVRILPTYTLEAMPMTHFLRELAIAILQGLLVWIAVVSVAC